jgi:uncharacterized membrane protein
MASILYGLFSALAWGAGDFTGGIASRRSGALRIAFLSEVAGIIPLVIAQLFLHESDPVLSTWVWCGIAGVIGSTGLLIFYRSLAESKMTVAAPVSAVTSVILPLAIGSLMDGFPPVLKFAGFVLAVAAIWLISRDGRGKSTLSVHLGGLIPPFVAGICFGFYFILIHQGSQTTIIWPLIIARCAGALTLFVFSAIKGKLKGIEHQILPIVFLIAMLDIGGNTFYILSSQTGRMDMAAVLGSLCPGVTVLMAMAFLHERLKRVQAIGILIALVAIVLMTL